MAAPTVDMAALPGVLGPRTLQRTVKYASDSISDFGFFTTIYDTELTSLDFAIRSLVLTSFSVNFHSAFRIPNSAIVDPVARPSSRFRDTNS